ncbi:MAG TPA: DUF167 domain-containing protein [Nanoarchaeota archaeon]|nr:DUF167 domain-containing protein [Candidatus Pacearchaeota archaeon]HIH18277.1 DUF167 domain-containing protein [Nanoarchaeota archaeon]HIH34147.1 DUF167 domain-containing protein [Nanoarchaeota archaeon]HIH51543.1 DUF167 domain-containing protein [Nanoarchaeota archaeon]HIH65754.1 DUF167 domain-containing protein [Nanoarchaeota archaeon]
MKIQIKVSPGAKKEEVLAGEDGQLLVRVKASAEKGKANAAVEKLLGKYLGKGVRITSGFSSRKKIVETY